MHRPVIHMRVVGAYCDDVEAAAKPEPYLADLPPAVRADFVRKVYALVCFQLLLTGAVAAAVTCEPAVRHAVQGHPEAFYASFVCGMFALCALTAYKDRHPINLALLFLFTSLEAYAVAFVCAAYVSSESSAVISGAFATTTLLFGGLSVYVHASRQDLSWLGGVLAVAMGALLLMGLAGVLFPSLLTQTVVASLGVATFSGMVLYDTSMLLYHLTADDAVLAAIQLYLDFVNLFLYTLQCALVGTDG